jgi:hypothetical protein
MRSLRNRMPRSSLFATVVRKTLIPFVVIGAIMVILLSSRAPVLLTQSHAPVKGLAKRANLQAYVRYIYGMHVHLVQRACSYAKQLFPAMAIALADLDIWEQY